MIKVSVTTDALKLRAESIMAQEVMHNPNLNGANYSVELGDFNEIDADDNIIGASLFQMIFRAEK